MTPKEAILRIKHHMEIHKLSEPNAIYITEALNMAIQALEEQIEVIDNLKKSKGWIEMSSCEKCLFRFICEHSNDSTECLGFTDSNMCVKLPCKSGETIYWITDAIASRKLIERCIEYDETTNSGICRFTVDDVYIVRDGVPIGFTVKEVPYHKNLFAIAGNQFGRTVFRTPEEAVFKWKLLISEGVFRKEYVNNGTLHIIETNPFSY